MGKYKRSRRSVKTALPNYTCRELITYLRKVFKLRPLNHVFPEDIHIECLHLQIREVDRCDYRGYEYVLWFSDKTAYIVGDVIVTDDDGISVETYDLQYCVDYYKSNTVHPYIVYSKMPKNTTL